MKKNNMPALKDQVYTIIKNRLLEQTYQGGHILTERALAEELRVSRTPVRAALQQLQKKAGFVMCRIRELSFATWTKKLDPYFSNSNGIGRVGSPFGL